MTTKKKLGIKKDRVLALLKTGKKEKTGRSVKDAKDALYGKEKK